MSLSCEPAPLCWEDFGNGNPHIKTISDPQLANSEYKRICSECSTTVIMKNANITINLGNSIEDLKKAICLLNDEINKREKHHKT